ncbi:hypothetical protein EGW08_022725 [Elysia chlorotica]|uniref:Palmitoyltransferase n=1 Tax=Elysia chlorotica TaxID=188477 RepID=A0A433SK91_ELYCH|nr:hypothetical protein EGW08_022725 [Elysia chlorotica]
MKGKAETVLRIISAVCQFYYASYSATSLYLGLTLTIPEYCLEDPNLLQFMTYLMLFVFGNMMGNFFCIIYKSKLSIVKPAPNASANFAQLPTTNTTQDYLSSSLSASESTYSNAFHPKNSGTLLNNNLRETQNQTNTENTLDSDFKSKNQLSNYERTGVEILGGWQRCKDCFVLTPPRGKHCPLCKHCVLKRDHHCYFVGHCIGFHNQRFFVCFCLYGGLGGLYSLWLTSHYLRVHYEALQTWGRLAYVGPFALLHWALGYTSGANLGMVMFWWWSLVTSLMGCCYCFGQILLVIRGQTKWEFFQDKFTYRGTLTDNIQSVFGRYWPICFFLPAPFLGYVGDGANWDNLFSDWKTH